MSIYPSIQQITAPTRVWQHPELWEGCIGAWCPGLGIMGNTVYDYSAYGGARSKLSFNGSPTWGSDSKYGFKTLSFASNQWLTGPTAAYLNGGSGITVSAWHNFAGTFTGGNYAIASKSGSLSDGWVLYLSNTAPAFGANISGVGVKIASSSTTLTANTGWHHILGVYDGSALKVYTDGVLGATVTQAGTIAASSTAFSIAALYNTTGSSFIGAIDDVRVYNWAMPAEAAVQLAKRRGIAWQVAPIQVPSGTVLRNLILSASSGSFSLTGSSANLLRALKLSAASGSFSLTGSNANLLAVRKLSGASGSFAVTGSNASLLRSLKLSAASGSFAVTGSAANLLTARKVSAASGSFAVNGSGANLLTARKVSAASGSFALAGSGANLLTARKLSAASGSYSLTGSDASLLATRKISASAGSFSLTGSSLNLLWDRILSARAGQFTLTGQDADPIYIPSLVKDGKVVAASSFFQGPQASRGFLQGSQASAFINQGSSESAASVQGATGVASFVQGSKSASSF